MAEPTSKKEFDEAAFNEFLKEATGKDLPRWRSQVTHHVKLAHIRGHVDASNKDNYRAALDNYNAHGAYEGKAMLEENSFITGLPKSVGSTIGDRSIRAEIQYNGDVPKYTR
jgi:hypothetical protein